MARNRSSFNPDEGYMRPAPPVIHRAPRYEGRGVPVAYKKNRLSLPSGRKLLGIAMVGGLAWAGLANHDKIASAAEAGCEKVKRCNTQFDIGPQPIVSGAELTNGYNATIKAKGVASFVIDKVTGVQIPEDPAHPGVANAVGVFVKLEVPDKNKFNSIAMVGVDGQPQDPNKLTADLYTRSVNHFVSNKACVEDMSAIISEAQSHADKFASKDLPANILKAGENRYKEGLDAAAKTPNIGPSPFGGTGDSATITLPDNKDIFNVEVMTVTGQDPQTGNDIVKLVQCNG